jgi:glycine/D-amino acid oxidase-like deaminating enzyme
VGGGIVGCAVAYELTRQGASVVLLERDELAAGASGRNHGLLVAPLDPVLGPMASTTLDAYRSFLPEAPTRLSLDPDPIGYLIVGSHDESQHEDGEAEAKAAESCGVRVERLAADDVLRLEPNLSADLVAEGWLLDDIRRVQPAMLTASLALVAADRGCEVHRHLSVREIVVDGDRARGVLTDQGTIPSDHVVVAAGPWSPGLLRPVGFDLPVMAARGWLVGLAPVTVPFSRVLGRAGWHSPPDPEGLPPLRAGEVLKAVPAPAVGTLLQPNIDGTVLVGGSRQLAFTNEPEDPDIPHRLLEGAVSMVPSLSRARVLSAWWGLRPMTPDGRPMIGPLSDGLIVAAGHGSLGVTLAGGTARLVEALISGGAVPFEPSPFDPVRFGGPGVPLTGDRGQPVS